MMSLFKIKLATIKKIFLPLLLAVLGIIVIREIGVYNLRTYIFPVATDPILPSYKNGSLISVKTDDREANAYFVRVSDKLMVFFHGNGDTINCYQELMARFINAGYSVLLVEYPGYGVSSRARPSESAIYHDSLVLIQTVQQKAQITPENTVLMGYSLGTGVASEMATHSLASKMILVSPHTSIPAIASQFVHPLFAKIFIKDTFDTLSKCSKINIPVFIIHGKQDTVIPYSMGVQLHNSFAHAQLLTIPDTGHEGIAFITQQDIWNKIDYFLKH